MKLVCLARLERALNALSTRSLCHWGTGTFGRYGNWSMAGRRMRRPYAALATAPTGRSRCYEFEVCRGEACLALFRHARLWLEDASGYDPHAYGLKVRSLSIRV